jgi:hypothetical protein
MYLKGQGFVPFSKVPAHPLGHVVAGSEDIAGGIHRRRRVPERRLLAVEVEAKVLGSKKPPSCCR